MAKINKRIFLFWFCFVLFSCTNADKAKLSSLSGYLAWKQNDWNSSVSHFLTALELGTQMNDEEIKRYSNYGIGAVYLMQNEDESAVNRFKNITDLQDKNLQASVLYQLGIISFKMQKYEDAAAFFKHSLELVSGSVDAKINYELSKKYLQKKDTGTAEHKDSTDFDVNEENIFDKTIIEFIQKKERVQWQNMEQDQKPLPFDY